MAMFIARINEVSKQVLQYLIQNGCVVGAEEMEDFLLGVQKRSDQPEHLMLVGGHFNGTEGMATAAELHEVFQHLTHRPCRV